MYNIILQNLVYNIPDTTKKQAILIKMLVLEEEQQEKTPTAGILVVMRPDNLSSYLSILQIKLFLQ
jgi:hypothetical protein